MEWSAALLLLKQVFAKSIVIHNGDEVVPARQAYFTTELMQCDTFHPFNSEQELLEAINMQSPDFDEIANAALECLYEMHDLLLDWCMDIMNHPPGYKKPTSVEFVNEDAAIDAAEEFARAVIART